MRSRVFRDPRFSSIEVLIVAISNILVTGANGLIGKSLADRLAPDHNVIGMDRFFSAPPPFPHVQADINDIERLHATLKQHAVTQIIHCGAISGRVVARDNPFTVLETNVGGTAAVFEAARVFGISRIVFCSSAAAYGNDVPALLTEDQPLNGTTVYGASKACGEAIMRSYITQFGLNAVALRIFQVFGPRRTTECYIRDMIENAYAGRVTRIAQPGHSRRQYVYVDDIVDALLLALNAKTLPRSAYNAAGDTSLTLSEVADTVKEIVPGVQVAFGDDRQGDQYKIQAVDLSIAQKELGYYPKVSLEEGIERYARWLKEK